MKKTTIAMLLLISTTQAAHKIEVKKDSDIIERRGVANLDFEDTVIELTIRIEGNALDEACKLHVFTFGRNPKGKEEVLFNAQGYNALQVPCEWKPLPLVFKDSVKKHLATDREYVGYLVVLLDQENNILAMRSTRKEYERRYNDGELFQIGLKSEHGERYYEAHWKRYESRKKG